VTDKPTKKIRVDAAALTLAEHAEAAEVVAAAGHDPDAPGSGFYSVAAMAYLTQRRTDPTFTFEQALTLRMGDLDLVNDETPVATLEVPNPEAARVVSNGGAPQPSRVSGP